MSYVYQWRPHGNGPTPQTVQVPQKASEVYRVGDLCKRTSGAGERVIDPAGTDGYVTITTGTHLWYCLKGFTAAASVTVNDTFPAMLLADIDLLVRLVDLTASGLLSSGTAANAELRDFTQGTSYVMGIHEWGTGSNNYQPVLSAQTTGGNYYIVEACKESDAADDYGLAWVHVA